MFLCSCVMQLEHGALAELAQTVDTQQAQLDQLNHDVSACMDVYVNPLCFVLKLYVCLMQFMMLVMACTHAPYTIRCAKYVGMACMQRSRPSPWHGSLP